MIEALIYRVVNYLMSPRITNRRHRTREYEFITALFVQLALGKHLCQLDLSVLFSERVHHKTMTAVADT